MPRGTTHDCLAISGGGQEPRTISLSAKNPRGMLIGRTPDCAVPLESIRVSRRHARLFQDPFQRWIIEDLGSHNGLWVHGRRASIHAMTPGEPVSIGPFRVALTRPDGMPVLPDAGPTAAKGSVYNDDSTTVVTPAAGTPKPVPVLCMKQLNEIIDHMAALGSVALLYPEVCRLLAEREGAVAAILRLCPDEGAAPRANGVSGDPTVLAYRAADEDRHPGQEAGHCPRLSRRVLQ